MRFLQPGLFYVWAALLAVPIILYLFRPRPRTVLTSTLPFFKWLAREHQDNAWLRRLKQLLSLLMTLAVIAAGAASLGQLVVSPADDELETVVILIDRSASMDARQTDGRSCHEKAISLLRERLAGLPAGVGVSVIAYDRRPEVLLARTVDRREVERTLNSVTVRPVAGEAEPALSLAHRLAALETPAAIWHVTDYSPDLIVKEKEADESEEPPDESGDEPKPEEADPDKAVDENAEPAIATDIELKDFLVGIAQPVNAGITAFQLRRVPLQQARLGYEAFVQIRGSSSDPLAAELEVIREGELVQLRKLTIPPGGVETLLVPIEAQAALDEEGESGASAGGSTSEEVDGDSAGRLTLKLNVEGDVLATDNVVHAWIPKLKPIRVLWLSEKPDAFMQLAFSTITGSDDIQILQGSPSTWPPKEPVDVAIFDGWVPDEWPTNVEVIAIQPPKSSGPIQTAKIPGDGVPIDRLRVSEREHPLLYGVATERISLRQRIILDSTGPLQPLWTGPSGPVLVAGESQGQRVLVTAFRPEDSDRFPLMTSFPIFLANSVYWAAENRMSRVSGNNHRTGEIVELEGEMLSWPSAATGEAETDDTIKLTGEWNELTQPGLWETDTGQRGSAAMLAVSETVLPFDATEEVAAASSDDADSAFSALLRGDLVPLLMWSMLVLLLVESWLYHKHAV